MHNNNSSMELRTSELPEQYKLYEITLSDGSKFRVGGVTVNNIIEAKSKLVRLQNGDIINKSFIVTIRFEKKDTSNWFKALPEGDKKKIISQMQTA